MTPRGPGFRDRHPSVSPFSVRRREGMWTCLGRRPQIGMRGTFSIASPPPHCQLLSGRETGKGNRRMSVVHKGSNFYSDPRNISPFQTK